MVEKKEKKRLDQALTERGLTASRSQSESWIKLGKVTVDGQTISDEDLAASVQGQLLPLRNQEYEIKKKALEWTD